MEIDRFTALEQKIGIFFKNRNLLFQAMTHSSYYFENNSWQFENNARLEFLGDSVLGFVITEHLMGMSPKKLGGEMDTLRGRLVGNRMLSNIAVELCLCEFLLVSRDVRVKMNQAREMKIFGDTFEALVGAIYFDQGLETAKNFILKLLIPKLKEITEFGFQKDAKMEFNELAQAHWKITPIYRVIAEFGPDHNKRFEVGVYLEDELISKGMGFSRKEAMYNAAKAGIILMKGLAKANNINI